jgi:hypothetical protein
VLVVSRSLDESAASTARRSRSSADQDVLRWFLDRVVVPIVG